MPNEKTNLSPMQAHDHNVGNILSILTLMRNNTVALENDIVLLQQENEELRQKILSLGTVAKPSLLQE